MPEVHRNSENLVTVGPDWLIQLKKDAESSTNRRSRLLMHRSTDDVVQEMLIAFCKDSNIALNRAIGKSESLTVIEGEVLIVCFDESGTVMDRINMGAPGGSKDFMYRLCSTPWHSMLPLSDIVIIHECIEGPFVKVDDPSPDWFPQNPVKLADFLNKAAFE